MSLRKALLVGINAYRSAPLRGCVNDVFQMKEVLQRYYGFAEADMRILLDRDATAAGIKAGLEWLAQDGDDADAVRVFHYSGHGSFVADQNGDEPDGRDECLVPYDYESVGMLTDDVLKTYYDRFPRTGNLTLPDPQSAWTSLSRYLPRPQEMAAFRHPRAAWKVQTVGGWLVSPQKGGQRRRPVQMVQEGATLGLPGESRPPFGRVADVRPRYATGVEYPVEHAVYRCGYTVAIGFGGEA